MSTRQVAYYIAVTADGFIARKDGSVDGFLSEGHHIPDYLNSLRDYDTVLMGRHTYEFGYRYGLTPGLSVPTYAHMMQYVFSQSMPDYTQEWLRVIREDPAAFVKRLKAESGGSIYLCGGSQLATYLLRHHLIDRLILKVNPVLFGEGIPLFAGEVPTTTLALLDSKVYANGVQFQHYAVGKALS
jgi:dihydrofolate reductase